MGKKTNYFKLLQEQMKYIQTASVELNDALVNFDYDMVEKERDELHIVERQADNKAREIQSLLAMEFITPIDRDDLLVLTQQIDDIVDYIDDVLMKMYMYNISEMRPEAVKFGKLIVSSAETLQEVAAEFCNFRKSENINDLLLKLNIYEEDGDQLFMQAMASLYREEKDPIQVMAWTNMYEALESICDSFEDLSGLIERVIVKNT